MVGLLTWQSPIPGRFALFFGALLFGGLQLWRSVGEFGRLAKLQERCCCSALILRFVFRAGVLRSATLVDYSRVEETHTLSISRRHRSES